MSPLMAQEADTDDGDRLVRIPGLSHQDAAVVWSLLTAAGFFCQVHGGFPDLTDDVFVRAADLPDIKTFLKDYRVRGLKDRPEPIPW